MASIKLKAGNWYIAADVSFDDGKFRFKFPYNATLLDEIKTCLEGRKWDAETKTWTAPVTQRNIFVLDYLKGKYGSNPYSRFDKPIGPEVYEAVRQHCAKRGIPAYSHQVDAAAHGLDKRWFVWAYEMGTGKTLAAIIVAEICGYKDVVWVGPKSALRAVELDFKKWKTSVHPYFVTYDSLRRVIEDWPDGHPAPRIAIFDECSKLKNPTAKRTLAAKHLADSMREEYGTDCIIGLMSGTPAPKSPADWWSLCEIACPGFLREGNYNLFKRNLALIEDREAFEGGGTYPHLITWLDDENKCAKCGQLRDHQVHSEMSITVGDGHDFAQGKNEVARLYKRMKGLVITKLKKDCLDLPEKRYEIRRCQPSEEILRAARLILSRSTRAAQALIELRELSDGFQYTEIPDGSEVCPLCHGTKEITEYFHPDDPGAIITETEVSRGIRFVYDQNGEVVGERPAVYVPKRVACTHCGGAGEVPKFARSTIQIPCPKEEVLKDELEYHEEVGRLNIYAGFQGSVDRIVSICHAVGWTTLRVDGRGWHCTQPDGSIIPGDHLQLYTDPNSPLDRMSFVGQPGAAGMGLTLTCAPTTVFWSNDFNAESRQQAEDRGHRIGMDVVRGGRILDIIHLDTDEYVLQNLLAKRDLQHLSMTGLKLELKGILDAGTYA